MPQEKINLAGRVYADREGLHGVDEQELKELQKAFRGEYCKSCIHFDILNDQFKNTGHLSDSSDCYFHWTDIVGQCHNFKWNL